MRSPIVSVDHAATEMVLTRQCADVSKLMSLMRIIGDVADHDLLASFEGQLPSSVSLALRRSAGPLLVAGHHGSHLRWLGPSDTVGVALPALVESCIICGPLVSIMVDGSSAAFGWYPESDDHG